MKAVPMSTGRSVVRLTHDMPERQTVTASDGKEVAVAAVDNEREGICPKCRGTMGTGTIPLGQVYYCSTCRVTTPIPEE